MCLIGKTKLFLVSSICKNTRWVFYGLSSTYLNLQNKNSDFFTPNWFSYIHIIHTAFYIRVEMSPKLIYQNRLINENFKINVSQFLSI